MTNFEYYYATHGIDSTHMFFASFKHCLNHNKEFLKVKSHKEFVEFMMKEHKEDVEE